jgi:hypothetical protein
MFFVSGLAHGADCAESVFNTAGSILGRGEVGGGVPPEIGNRRKKGKDEQSAEQGDDDLPKNHGPSLTAALLYAVEDPLWKEEAAEHTEVTPISWLSI